MGVVIASEIPTERAYRLLTGTVVPRPVAWISTRGHDGTRNLAPFSYFMGVGMKPPTIAVSVNDRAGQRKDTLRNIEETGEFVINIADESLLERMVRTSGEWDYDVDEFDDTGLTEAESVLVKPGRVAEAPVALECKLLHVTRIGRAPNMTGLIVGEIVAWHLRDDILNEDGLPDMGKFNPVARMIGDEYLLTRERRLVARPQGSRP